MREIIARVSDLFAYLDKAAPVEMKRDFDNVGHLVGRGELAVTRVLIALDITDEVIDEAIDLGAELIVSHHPLFFSLKSVTDGDLTGRKILKLAGHDMAAICMHTNLDAAAGGVNDALAGALGLVDTELFREDGRLSGEIPYGIGRIGCLPERVNLADFLERVTAALGTSGLRYHDAGRPVHRVAVMGGSGGDEVQFVHSRGCDTYVTADIKYNAFLDARELGINLIDGDHFCTENVVCPNLRELIHSRYPRLQVSISTRHGQTARFYTGR